MAAPLETAAIGSQTGKHHRLRRMRPSRATALGTWLVLAGAVLGAGAAPLQAQLNRKAQRQLDSLLDAPPYNRTLWGVALVDDAGKLLFGRNPDRLFVPASNTKLVVSAIAAALFPPSGPR